ncbi:N-6 DNA methylase [Phyllobacterium sp. SYP-B3895]|uniref:N-6 DNA methylase n=1 Tax=Phyllobacterium sp. SYP-B3895 TaxID=2663240 RepID=UPI0012995A5D|nr:N-6 DNA methylase [Phyllobacterium sp. SYP-B3895]MRG54213.1 N-6 DNA methylase [Phyllobacterium sp. SYP-B3895]
MALRAKEIWLKDIERRSTGYYSTPDFVSEFVFERLKQLKPHGRIVLDPCIGQGEMAKYFKRTGHHVVGYDVTDFGDNYADDFRQADFIETFLRADEDPLFSSVDLNPEYIIANPPYNCHEIPYIRENKGRIQRVYGKDAALNTYALFLKILINIAPPGCILGLIISDSFLTASGYYDLRRAISSECTVHGLHLCPTDLFRSQKADVRTCILILEKNGSGSDLAHLSQRPRSTSQFEEMLRNRNFLPVASNRLVLSDPRDKSEFIIAVPDQILELFSGRRLDDVATCFTGISTGNDKQYLKKEKTPGFGVPFYKNPASRSFYTEPDAYLKDDFMRIGDEVSNFMIRNKELLGKPGITCSSMGVVFSAALRPSGTACGVNPNILIGDHDKWWMLSYLNSKLCLFLIRAVMIRGNMITPGYLARLPVPELAPALREQLSQFAQQAYAERLKGEPIISLREGIDSAIYRGLGLSSHTVNAIEEFSADPVKLS